MAATDPDERVELRPFREQEPFLGDSKTYYGFLSGVGAGKTFAGILRTALNMHEWNPGELGAIVAPTTTMVKDVILSEMRDLGLMNEWEYKSQHTDEPGIHAPNGARALILSADNRRTIERLRGLNLAWFWIDEGSDVPERARDILTQRLRVGNYRNGYVTTTPEGKNHVYDFFVGDVDGSMQEHGEAEVYEADDRLSILRVPSFANPHTPDDFKQQLRRDHEGAFFEQEVLGRFVDFEGLVYPWFDPDEHVLEDDQRLDEVRGNVRQVIYGVDWGFRGPSVILTIGVTSTGEYVVLEEFYQNRVTVNDLVRIAHDLQDRYRPGTFYCDPAEPASIEEFQRSNIDAMEADNDVTPGIQRVTALQDDLLVHESCENVRNEFGMYRYKDGDETEDVVKKNDHAMDALRYAIHTHHQRGGLNVGVGW